MGLKDYSEQSFEEMAANQSQETTENEEKKEVESTEEASDEQ